MSSGVSLWVLCHCSAITRKSAPINFWLPFDEAGLIEIRSYTRDETSALGDHDFAEKTALWTEVIDNVASALQKSGFCGAALLDDARNIYEDWRKKALVKQTLSMKAVVGKVPTANEV